MKTAHKQIKRDTQIWKFSFYGLLKNLKFFEPFLLIFLLSEGISLFQIGILYSIREIITYIFEIPSGILADNYGKRKELSICFIFYIVSFVLFYLGTAFYIFAVAMFFFGLGEAFRSGTHKSMIYSYLEQKNWFEQKDFVYGRTRSFSLIGSALSSFLSIVFVLRMENLRGLFLLCIAPYIADFILILTYPKNLDNLTPSRFSFKEFGKQSLEHIKSLRSNKNALRTITSSSLFDAVFKSIKDYIQPILQSAILSIGFLHLANTNGSADLKITLGVVYGLIYIASSAASKNAYRLKFFGSSSRLMNYLFDGLGAILILLAVFVKFNLILPIIILYIIIFITQNIRRPLFVDVIGDFMGKNERATVLSVESQQKSLFVVLLAPLFGFIADNVSIAALFVFIGAMMLILNRIVSVPEK